MKYLQSERHFCLNYSLSELSSDEVSRFTAGRRLGVVVIVMTFFGVRRLGVVTLLCLLDTAEVILVRLLDTSELRLPRFGVVALLDLVTDVILVRLLETPLLLPFESCLARRRGVGPRSGVRAPRFGVAPRRGVVSRISIGGFFLPRAGVPAARARAKNSRILLGDFGPVDLMLAFFFMRRLSKSLAELPSCDEEAGHDGDLMKIKILLKKNSRS